ncbi:unnamed protein product [Phaedon cochleariae]|uniref:Period circadian protein n=1 Tax=Phaedon cochleariae TaxID=80249 RepID=A0A9P0DDT5_PHACE|nr:unnamed protein product [Phaedon cochleariae]
MESETGTTNTKISDSAYSNSCSHTNSQRSASSKSRHSGSNSSRSSGYCGATNPDGSSVAATQLSKSIEEDEHKNKKPFGQRLAPIPSSKSPSAVIRESTNVDDNQPAEKVTGDVAATSPTPKDISTSLIEDSNNKANEEENKVFQADTTKTAKPSLPEKILPYWCEQNHHQASPKNVPIKETIEPEVEPNDEHLYQPQDGFCCVISMYDGVVLHTTPSLTSVLGFPKDMWLGRSFIDFVHPKDRKTFSSQVTSDIAHPLIDSDEKYKNYNNCLYVCLRKYRGLKSGFGVVEKAVAYQAFQLTVRFKQIQNAPEMENHSGMFLVVAAVPVYTSYKVPDERRKSPKFGMRHTAACLFSHVDPDVVTNFGFFPQDMLGKSIFDFYHPDDMHSLKEIYESVMTMCQKAGSVYRSKPYRFAVKNGGFAMIETEWSSFVNPWSRRLEFVIGLHKVLQGPPNPDIFQPPTKDDMKNVSEELLDESKTIRGEILILLNKELPRPTEAVKYEVSKRCKDLANFMESLMDEVNKSNLQIDLPQELDPTISVSLRRRERGSVMLGEISPHHDYCDSKSSSETPPSYNQLNYNENIQRFFQSKPNTTVSDENNGAMQGDTFVDDKRTKDNQKRLSPIRKSGTSGSGSAGNLSSVSNVNIESGTASLTNTSNDSYKPPHLTESILVKHNEDMEKIMIKKHRVQRSNIKDRDSKKSHQKLDKISATDRSSFEKNEQLLDGYAHGIKRCGTHSRDGDNHKVSKHKHQPGVTKDKDENGTNGNDAPVKPVNNQNQPTTNTMAVNDTIYQSGLNNVDLWPPFSVTVTSMTNEQPRNITATSAAPGGFATGMLPIYYIPTTHQRTIPGPFIGYGGSRYPVQYMHAGMLYNHNTPMYPSSPIMCPAMPMLPLPMVPPMTPVNPTDTLLMGNVQQQVSYQVGSHGQTTDNKPDIHNAPFAPRNSTQLQRSVSQATSVRAEPGSALGSITNKITTEPAVSGNEMNFMSCNNNNNIDESSSCCSFSYSSFLKTDAGSGSNDDTNMMDTRTNKSEENTWKGRRNYPIRKKDPPWLESVQATPDLIYRYQMTVQDLEDILQADLKRLKETNQPMLVNDQLQQLYIDLELEGMSKTLSLEEGITSSSSSCDEFVCFVKPKKKRKSFSSLVMIYEENAPFPPPPH